MVPEEIPGTGSAGPGNDNGVHSHFIESIPLGVFRLSPSDGYPVAYANRSLALMLGYDSVSGMIGARVQDFLHPSTDAALIQEMLFEKGGLSNFETTLVRKDGSDIRVEITAKLQFAADQSLAHVEGYCEDITERRVLEMEMQYHDAELNRYALALTQANKKLNLLQSISRHDILNQLTALGGNFAMMKASIRHPRALDFIETGEKITDAIVNQVRFTRDYQDVGVVSPQWFDVQKTIREATASLPPGGVTIETNVPGLMIYADPLLEKVFFNLVENALRHAKGLTRIWFSFRKSGDAVVIVCEDDGPGVPAEHKKAIFRREYYKNTGFGLFLSREILDITGITIQETGDPGRGARFEITVPRDFFRISAE